MHTRLLVAALAATLLLPLASADGSPHVRVLLAGRWHGKVGNYGSIHAAVEAARPGDWIPIGPGDYHERPGSRNGVRITTSDVHLRGMSRGGVVIDGTRPGPHRPCTPQPHWQDLGPGGQGRNGIVVAHVSGVSIDNLTVCNFVGGRQGHQVAFDGGYGNGRTGLGAFEGSYLTATSTLPAATPPSTASSSPTQPALVGSRTASPPTWPTPPSTSAPARTATPSSTTTPHSTASSP